MRNMPLEKQYIWENGGFKLLKLYFNDTNNTVIDNEEIYQEQLKIEETLCDESVINYGKCSSKKFTVRIFASSLSFLNCKLKPTLTINPDTEFADTIKLGTYNVISEKRTADRMYKDIVAYDDLYIITNTDVSNWYNGLTFPITLKNFRDSFFEYFNLEQETIELPLDDLMIEKTINPSTLTGLTVIEAICEINGCFGQINYDGKFTYVYLNSKEEIIYPSNDLYPSDTLYPLGEFDYSFTMNDYVQNGVTYEDYVTRSFTAIIVRENENDIGGVYPSTSASTDNPYTITNNFLLYGASNDTLVRVAKTVYEKNVNVYYVPGKVKTWYKPWLELGDTISAQTKTGMVYFPILKRTISGITSIFDEYETKGEETFNTKINSAGTQIEQLRGKANELSRSIDETRSTITDVEKGLKSEIKQTSDAITSEIKRAEGEEKSLSSRITQTAESIESEVTRATEAEGSINSKITQTAENISAEVTRAKGVEDNLSGKIDLTSESLTSEISRAKGEESSLNSKITQTATDITSEVTRATEAEGALSSRISQTAESISLNVTNGEEDASISLTITKEDGSTVTTTAKTIKFTGDVIFASDLTDGTTSISGDNIKTGKIAAEYIDADNLKVKEAVNAQNITATLITGKTITGSTFSSSDKYGNGVKIGNGYIDLNKNVDDNVIPIGEFHATQWRDTNGLGLYCKDNSDFIVFGNQFSEESYSADLYLNYGVYSEEEAVIILNNITKLPSSKKMYFGDSSYLQNGLIEFGNNTWCLRGTMAGDDYWEIRAKSGGTDKGWLDIATGDNGNEAICVSQYGYGVPPWSESATLVRRAFLLDSKGDTIFPGELYANGTNIVVTSYVPESNSNQRVKQLLIKKTTTLSSGYYLEVVGSHDAFWIEAFYSDTKLKENISETEVNALDKLKQINMIQFDWNGKMEIQQNHVDLGISANQLQEIIPEAVNDVEQPEENEFDSLKQINISALMPYCIKAIQELSDKIDEQQKEINELKELLNNK